MTTTANLGITKLNAGQANAHVTVNIAMDGFDSAIAGRLPLALTGASTSLTGAQSTAHILHVTSTTVATDLVVQAVPKSWIVVNDGSHTVTVKRAGQSGAPTVTSGHSAQLYCDGTDVRAIA